LTEASALGTLCFESKGEADWSLIERSSSLWRRRQLLVGAVMVEEESDQVCGGRGIK